MALSADSPSRGSSIRVLLVTGATGGHVSPALALAAAFRAAGPEVHCVLTGPAGGVARELATRASLDYAAVDVHPVRGAGPARALRGVGGLPAAAWRAASVLRSVRPHLVVGTGAATSGPVVGMAALTGIPTLVFEANVESGLANAWLGPGVEAVAAAWPEAARAFGGRGFHAGCPVRGELFDVGDRTAASGGNGTVRLLVLGGSGGAPDLDRAFLAALRDGPGLPPGVAVTHQASPSCADALREGYRAAGVEARVETFLWDMPAAYGAADLVVARSGGMTLGELGAVGRPSIVVPLPTAGDHQRANAAAWAAAGAAVAVHPEALAAGALPRVIAALGADPERRARMRDAALARRRRDAAAAIAARGLALVARRRR